MKTVNNYLVIILMMAFLIPAGLQAQDPVAKKEEVKKEVKKTAEVKKKQASKSDIKKYSKKTLKKGSKGEAVKSLQEGVNKNEASAKEKERLGNYEIQRAKAKSDIPDAGIGDKAKKKMTASETNSKSGAKFGKGTKKGVVDFQKKKKLDADGKVGPKTNAKVPNKISESMKKKNKKKDKKKNKTLKKDQ